MPPVRLSLRAERWFLQRIADIAAQNPQAARKLLARMEKTKDMLSDFPRMTERGLQPGTRKVSMPPFILTARFRNGIIEIATIRHARQKDALAPFDPRTQKAHDDDDEMDGPDHG